MRDTARSSRTPREEGELRVGSRAVRALLNRHGVPAMRHVTLIAELLGMGYTQVFRRMNGSVAWELEEIESVASHLGETLGTVFADAPVREPVPAVLSIDGAQVPCQLVVGAGVTRPHPNSLVAMRVGSQWVVAAGSVAGVGPCFAVEHLEVQTESRPGKRIAILDDDRDEAMTIAEYFVARGCEAQAFTDTESLLRSMRLKRFDAFVVDWVLREGSAGELVALIRAEDRECPIAILTGKMEEDLRVEADVAEALATHRLMYFQKPTRLALISSQLLRALAGH